jgi:hypothetical protein
MTGFLPYRSIGGDIFVFALTTAVLALYLLVGTGARVGITN